MCITPIKTFEVYEFGVTPQFFYNICLILLEQSYLLTRTKNSESNKIMNAKIAKAQKHKFLN